MDALSQLVRPLSFLFIFVILWLIISGGLALASGWWSLAAKFRQMEPLRGERFTSVSGAIRNERYPLVTAAASLSSWVRLAFRSRFCYRSDS
jgi:hypothetical protein